MLEMVIDTVIGLIMLYSLSVILILGGFAGAVTSFIISMQKGNRYSITIVIYFLIALSGISCLSILFSIGV